MKPAPSPLSFRRQFFRSSATFALALFAAGCASPLHDPARNSAVRPEPREGNWLQRHEGFVQIARQGNIDLLFVGDSITDGWRNRGKEIWEANFAQYRAANFGIGGDRTQHVLWRLEHGELDGIKPKVVVLMIGTNNTGFERDQVTRKNTTQEIIAGVSAIVQTLRTKLPDTRILLLAIFPRAEKPDHPQRLQVNQVNARLAEFDDGDRVRFLNINANFLAPDGTLPKEIMPDFLHPHEHGYAIWAAAIREPLARMMNGL